MKPSQSAMDLEMQITNARVLSQSQEQVRSTDVNQAVQGPSDPLDAEFENRWHDAEAAAQQVAAVGQVRAWYLLVG